MNSAQLSQEIKDMLVADVDGVEEVKRTKRGLRVTMDDRRIFLIRVSRLDDDEEELEDDGEEDEEELDDDGEEDFDDDDDDENG